MNQTGNQAVNQAAAEKDTSPWHREVWFWMVFGPLLFIIVLCGIMVAIAFYYSDDLVSDNYYKEGRMINQILQQDERALALGLSASVKFDAMTGEVLVSLGSEILKKEFNETNSANDKELPKQLLLFFDHPVKKTQDQALVLHEISAGEYRAALTHFPKFSWYLALVPEVDIHRRKQAEWLLSGHIDFSTAAETMLQPRVK
jgi:uncharacterized protein